MELSLSSICLFKEYRLDNSVIDKQPKIKRRLKTLKQYLNQFQLIELKWIDLDLFHGLVFIFNHGVISSIGFSEDYSILSVHHEHFILNKLLSKKIASIELTKKFLIITYFEPFVACVPLEQNIKFYETGNKFKIKTNAAVKILNLEKFVKTLSHRNLTLSERFAILWWNHCHLNQTVSSDTLKNNILILSLEDLAIWPIDYSIEGEIVQVDFVFKEPCKFGLLNKHQNFLYNLVYQLFEIIYSTNRAEKQIDEDEFLKRNTIESVQLVFKIQIPLEKPCIRAEFTRCQDKILLLCDDESIMLFNIEQNILYSLNSSMPIDRFHIYPLDSIFVTCNQSGSISIYDMAFNNIQYRLRRKNFETEHFDLNQSDMIARRLQFLSPKILALFSQTDRDFKIKNSYSADCCFHLIIIPMTISFQRLIIEYVHRNLYEEAINVQRIINWNCSYDEAYSGLQSLFQNLIKLPFDDKIDDHIESTLASFLLPMTPIDYKIFEKILPSIRQLAIKFFYHLLRNGSLEKAHRLAIELKSPRLFLLLSHHYRINSDDEQALKAYEQAKSCV
ncbi:hypothetical protein SSS_10483 [Sarcoptes scabiei]|uniref:WD repeat-containing and planar cell polarity effector protein fritz -like protein n=1 Tax=Sarcoptes scabiei TaxID=52283 RepID=A0A834VC99_SARSC|nr:hypothetical protein SSS_10483 [Sarcoptes scabiei]